MQLFLWKRTNNQKEKKVKEKEKPRFSNAKISGVKR